MAKKVLIKEIKSWLLLERYDVFQSLDIESVMQELEFRIMYLIDYTSDDEDSNEEWLYVKNRVFEAIMRGCVLSADIAEHALSPLWDSASVRDKFSQEPIEYRVNDIPVISNHHGLRPYHEELSGNDSIIPFTMGDLVSYYRFYLQNKRIEHGHRVSEINHGRIFASVSAIENKSSEFEDEVVIKVNLASYTDDELLAEFKVLLKDWRCVLDIEEPLASKTRVGNSTIKKIITYKVFPFLDLMLWELINGRKVSNDIASRVLYPDDGDEIMEGHQIKDTVRPFVERMVYEDTYSLIMHYIKKNSEVKKMRLSDVMKLAED